MFKISHLIQIHRCFPFHNIQEDLHLYRAHDSFVLLPGELLAIIKSQWAMPTSIQAARHGVTFAGRAFKVRRGAIYQRTGSSRLGLRPATVTELGTQG